MPRQQTPPKDFDPRARGIWKAAQGLLRRQGTWRPADRELLAQYVRNVSAAHAARAQLAKEGITTTTHDGRPIPHPCVKIARDAEADARSTAADLLLTPASRKRAGVEEPKSLEDELAILIS